MQLAAHCAEARQPALIITHGLSGSGKSWYAGRLVEALGAVQIRSDIERKRLYGYGPDAHSDSGIRTGIYSAAASTRTYARLADLAREVINGGYPVIADATFLKFSERERFRLLADELDIPFVILHCEADSELLHQRILTRRAGGADPSEADARVLEAQLESQEPLRSEERDRVITVNTGETPPVERVAQQLAAVTGLETS
jgi:hypothetical protein